MPALIPQSVLDAGRTADIREAAENGWDLQIRGRVAEHLQWFIDKYMPEGSTSQIYASPDKDYNVRAYCSREDFAIGMFQASLDIDYTKFKDTAKRYPWGQKYYELLIKVWSASTMLAPAGGYYAPRSVANPNGYSPKDYKVPERGQVGSTFFDDDHLWFGDEEDSRPAKKKKRNRKWRDAARRKSIHDMTDEELETLLDA